MTSDGGHAVLGPSAAHRWLTCPGSVGLIESVYPSGEVDDSSSYSREGTQAHTLAAIVVARRFGLKSKAVLTKEHKAWAKETPQEHHEEMTGHAEGYADFIESLVQGQRSPLILLEQRVYPGVPECDGTADAIVVAGGVLHTIDYKYGAGIPVSAEENPQLRLYSLGAYNLVQELLGDALGELDTVEMTIYQPRVSDSLRQSVESIQDLIRWRDSEVIPKAELALTKDAYLRPTAEACRFCPVAGRCKTRAAEATKSDFGDPRLLSLDELGQTLDGLSEIETWCTAVRAEALRLAYQEGQAIPGWKVVRARGRRTIKDSDKAIEKLVESGLDESEVSSRRIQTLAVLDRAAGGKDGLQQILGDLVWTPPGKESLAPESDPRAAIDRQADAVNDFTE